MKVLFTKHARRRMERRNVSEGTVFDILVDYEKQIPGSQGMEERVSKRIGNSIITVVFEELKRREQTILVITVIDKKVKSV